MAQQAYRIKEGLLKDESDLNKFAEVGFDLIPIDGGTDFVLVKVCELPFDSDIVQGSLNNIYNNPSWKRGFYMKNKEKIMKAYGLTYKGGKAVINDRVKAMLTKWQLRIWSPMQDGILTVHSGDPFENKEWSAAKNVEEVAGEFLIELLDKEYIEPINIEYTEENA